MKMKRAVALANFLAVVFLAHGFGEDIPISDKACNESSVICPCGEGGGQNFEAIFQTCSPTGENTTALSDAYRLRVNRFCSRFAHCETCLSGTQICATCPDGKSGRFCNEDTLTPAKNHRRRRTKTNLCEIPKYMETNTFHCYQKTSTIICVLHCDEGHTFLDGETWKKIKCNKMEGDWSPHGFRECKHTTAKCIKTDDDSNDRRKRSLCVEPKSMDTAEMFCKTSGNIRTCSVYCNQGYQFEGNVTRTVKCNVLEGLWTPTGFEECQRIQRKKRSSLCPVPKFMETNKFTCHEGKTYTTCHQTCNHGYRFREGSKRTIKCKNTVGTWKPHTFQQCTKIKRTKRSSLCPVPKFMETNTFTCNENKTHITCQQKCNDGYRFKEGLERTIKCKKSVGIWKPHTFQQCTSIERKKRDSLCAVPSFMETNTFSCSEIDKEITCEQTCKDGLSFREGSTRIIKCKTTVGIWKPNDFQQCI